MEFYKSATNRKKRRPLEEAKGGEFSRKFGWVENEIEVVFA
jgi:hypothetical protein